MTSELAGRDHRSQLLVGVDESVTSMRAVSYALGLARRRDCLVTLIHVTDMSRVDLVTEASMVADRDRAAMIARMTREVSEHAGIVTRFEHCSGDILQQLAQTAGRIQADMVIVGASTSFSHRISGSIAIRLVRRARWPVVVVP